MPDAERIRYLAELDASLPMPLERRAEILEEINAHLDDAWQDVSSLEICPMWRKRRRRPASDRRETWRPIWPAPSSRRGASSQPSAPVCASASGNGSMASSLAHSFFRYAMHLNAGTILGSTFTGSAWDWVVAVTQD